MVQRRYVVGGESSSGHEIASILGESPRGCVYTTTNRELRWEYRHNKGRMTERLKAIVARFNFLMSRIGDSTAPRDTKKRMYELLGKSLFAAMDSTRVQTPDETFADVETLIAGRVPGQAATSTSSPSRKVFVVHGHDEVSRLKLARFLESLKLIPVVLMDQPNAGRTIIEKFESESKVGLAVVLLTPDDVGGPRATPRRRKSRARQNVIFELGYFAAALGRHRVIALVAGGVEIPSDYQGVAYIALDANEGWKLKLAEEFRAAGVKIDLNKAR